MKKVFISLILAGIAASCVNSFASAPTAAGKEQAEPSFGTFVAYKLTEAVIWGAVGYAFLKLASSEFNLGGHAGNLLGNSGQSSSPKVHVTKSDTDLAKIVGEKPAELNQIIDMIDNPAKYKKLNAEFPKAFLLYGPPGTGKTELARGMAHKLDASFIELCGSTMESKWIGEPSENIRNLFATAREEAEAIEKKRTEETATTATSPATPSKVHVVLFIDEIDSIAPKRDSFLLNHHTKQSVDTLLSEMTKNNQHILIIGATNHKNSIDEAVLRPGRFDMHVPVKLPELDSREKILKHYAMQLPLDGFAIDSDAIEKIKADKLKKGYLAQNPHLLKSAINFDALAVKTLGFSGAYLRELVNKANRTAVHRNSEVVTQQDFDSALDIMLKQQKEKSEF